MVNMTDLPLRLVDNSTCALVLCTLVGFRA